MVLRVSSVAKVRTVRSWSDKHSEIPEQHGLFRLFFTEVNYIVGG